MPFFIYLHFLTKKYLHKFGFTKYFVYLCNVNQLQRKQLQKKQIYIELKIKNCFTFKSKIFMKINVVNLGGGLKRLDIEPSCSLEPRTIPTCVADDIMRDVVKREQSGNHSTCCSTQPRDSRGRFVSTRSWERPLPTPNREPDGIDIHVDRPLRQNYGGVQWAADAAFRKDMANYRSLEALAKKCDWPAREPMKGTEHLPQPTPATKFVGVPQSAHRATRPTCGCNDAKAEFVKTLATLAMLANELC